MEMIMAVLSGTGADVSPHTRICLASFFAIRLFTFVISAETIWEDDLQDLSCNSTQVGCRHQCYTKLSPLSPFILFTLQIIFIVTLSLVRTLYNIDRLRDNFNQAANNQRWKISFLNMLAKILIEGSFLYLCNTLYPGGQRQHTFKCDLTPCEQIVVCTMLKSKQKDAFMILMYTCSFACVLISVIEMYSLWKKFSKKVQLGDLTYNHYQTPKLPFTP
ncbi:gap junction beta-3 protein-like [Heptranchias perlo]|uniref:gap junction beta-3 protein-like n=1 Tax=Heptranchias perlo TaxID=212740 RepID=UPI00355ACCB6